MNHPGGPATLTAGGALLMRLKALGVEFIFANSGTDFPPIIEGAAQALHEGMSLPEMIIAPHEHAALGMAHGVYLASGKTQAVMLHTNVGLANGAIGAINAATDHVPMLLMSGRTPTTEQGRFGARTVPIGWGQEMRDQTALVREASKWDYELRFPEQTSELIDRALAIAESTPKGPVYLSLPREVLCEPSRTQDDSTERQMTAESISPRPAEIRQAAKLLADAKRPLIIVQHGTGSAEAFEALAQLSEQWSIPVCQYWAIALGVPADHPCYIGMNPSPWLEEADVVLAIDTLAPWSPDIHSPGADCQVIHIGPDPLQSRFPIRNFRADLAIASEVADGILALSEAMPKQTAKRKKLIEKRRSKVHKAAAKHRGSVQKSAVVTPQGQMTKAFVSRALGVAIAGQHSTVLSELGAPLEPIGLKSFDGWRQEPCSGGLGWSFPCGMGMKLADPERLVIATMGDGSYIFSNPVACHQIAEAYGFGIVVVILNNAEWGAVRMSVAGLYPDGAAARSNQMPLTTLAPSPDFAAVAQSSRAFALTVSDPGDMAEALEQAIAVAQNERRLALLNVMVAPG
ncbi:MAG: thiamine pyrophosphate-requiring protein [Pseudomonadota bacterium]